jgi:hypothetical protein
MPVAAAAAVALNLPVGDWTRPGPCDTESIMGHHDSQIDHDEDDGRYSERQVCACRSGGVHSPARRLSAAGARVPAGARPAFLDSPAARRSPGAPAGRTRRPGAYRHAIWQMPVRHHTSMPVRHGLGVRNSLRLRLHGPEYYSTLLLNSSATSSPRRTELGHAGAALPGSEDFTMNHCII